MGALKSTPPTKLPILFLGGRITALNILPAIFPCNVSVFVASTYEEETAPETAAAIPFPISSKLSPA